MIKHLTQEQRRKIVRLATEEGLSHAQLAERFGVSKKFVQGEVSRALGKATTATRKGGGGADGLRNDPAGPRDSNP